MEFFEEQVTRRMSSPKAEHPRNASSPAEFKIYKRYSMFFSSWMSNDRSIDRSPISYAAEILPYFGVTCNAAFDPASGSARPPNFQYFKLASCVAADETR